MIARNYTTPGAPLPGSVDWGAARIERLLEEEELRLRKALAGHAMYSARFRSAPTSTPSAFPPAPDARHMQVDGREEALWPSRVSKCPNCSGANEEPKREANTDPQMHLVDGIDWTTGGAAVGGTLGAIGGGLLGGVGGGTACTLVAPGVGTVACGAGGAIEGAVVGGSLGAGLGATVGSGIDALTSGTADEEEDLEEFCGRVYAGDVDVCNMLARRRGKRKAAACFAAASTRYANCLRGDPLPPLAGWNRINGF